MVLLWKVRKLMILLADINKMYPTCERRRVYIASSALTCTHSTFAESDHDRNLLDSALLAANWIMLDSGDG